MSRFLLISFLFCNHLLFGQIPENAQRPALVKSEFIEYLNVCKQLSNDFINNMNAGQYVAAHAPFTEELQESLTPIKLQGTWESIKEQYGDFIGLGASIPDQRAEATYYRQEIQFEKENFGLLLSVNDDQRISYLRVVPVKNKTTWTLPPYSNLNEQKLSSFKFQAKTPYLQNTLLPKKIKKKPL